MEYEDIVIYSLITFICCFISYITRKYWKRHTTNTEESYEDLKSYGDNLYKNREFKDALRRYFECKHLARTKEQEIETYNSIASCYMKIIKFKEALIYLDKSTELDINSNLDAIQMRSDCLYLLGRKKESFFELSLHRFLLSDNNKNNDKLLEKREKETCTELTNSFVEEKILPSSNIPYSEFFSTLVGLVPYESDNRLIELIKMKDYKKLDEFVFDTANENIKEGDLSLKIVKAGLYFLKGYYGLSYQTLEESDQKLERLFLLYLKLEGSSKNIVDKDIINDSEILGSKNPTILFYLAKIYLKIGQCDRYFEIMNKCKEHSFAYLELLYYFEDKKDKISFNELAYEAIKKFDGDMGILCKVGCYYAENGELEKGNEIISKMKDKKDPRTYFAKAISSLDSGNHILPLKNLKKALEVDPTYFKPYVYIVNLICKDDKKECKKLMKKGLRMAGTYCDVFFAYQMLVSLEMSDYVLYKILKERKNQSNEN
ncbi:hypothetical protein NGRA_0483 [Nosema granulosis]|uniref:Uncharacterized protein n=1 Tax=Nosema granulosis TaxID=83296 RepID=A0A9P6H0B5_9MICR|nr:hypothetical protein NGRA_0483 [Nosema granulosis]